MDAFNVPKKVNRHVLKALNFLSKGKKKGAITTAQILAQVKFQMRNLVPVQNVDMVIQKSLKNLSDIGLIERVGPQQYAVGSSYVPQSAPGSSGQNSVERRCFRPTVSRKRSISQLNPNFKRAQQSISDDSLSGDDYDRARKIMRSNNKKVKHVGRKPDLPKARQHGAKDDMQTPGLKSFDMGRHSDSSITQNLAMSMHHGSENKINRSYDYSSKSPLSPLVIKEIFPAKETSTALSNITELFTAKKYNNNDNTSPTELNSNSSSNSSSNSQSNIVKKEKPPSASSVNTNVVPSENLTSI